MIVFNVPHFQSPEAAHEWLEGSVGRRGRYARIVALWAIPTRHPEPVFIAVLRRSAERNLASQ